MRQAGLNFPHICQEAGVLARKTGPFAALAIGFERHGSGSARARATHPKSRFRADICACRVRPVRAARGLTAAGGLLPVLRHSRELGGAGDDTHPQGPARPNRQLSSRAEIAAVAGDDQSADGASFGRRHPRARGDSGGSHAAHLFATFRTSGRGRRRGRSTKSAPGDQGRSAAKSELPLTRAVERSPRAVEASAVLVALGRRCALRARYRWRARRHRRGRSGCVCRARPDLRGCVALERHAGLAGACRARRPPAAAGHAGHR